MRILEIHAIDGPNIHSHKPVISMLVDLEDYAEVQTDDLGADFRTALLQAVPGLSKHSCSRGYPGGFMERLQEGTYLGHVIEHVALELQSMANIGTIYGKTRFAGKRGYYNIVFEYKAQEAAKFIAREALNLVRELVNGQNGNVAAILVAVDQILRETELGPSTRAIINVAKERGIPFIRFGCESFFQLGYGVKSQRIQATLTGKTPCIAVDIACDKSLTKALLNKAGLPTPFGEVWTNVDRAVKFAQQLDSPVVVKPCDGNQGKGVSLNLNKEEEVRSAFLVAQQYSDQVIVERYVQGNHYRLTVVNGEMVAASLRIPAHVIGDGQHTIEELIEIINQDPLRGCKHEKPLTKITIDPVVQLVLKQQGCTLNYVPAKDETVYLRQNANLSTGGIAHDITDHVHSHNAWLAIRAAQIIGLDVAGIDLVMPDIKEPFANQHAAIIEVNAAPGIRMHHYPSHGRPRDVATAIVDYLFPDKGNGRIPLAAVTGTNGKTTTVRMITRMLREQYDFVGYTSSDGVYVNDDCLYQGDATGKLSAITVLTHGQVEAGVLEVARGGLIYNGLAYDYADVAIITNVGDDHIGQDGVESLRDLVYIKSLLAERVRPGGFVVLNADDKSVTSLMERARGRVILFSTKEKSPAIIRHLAAGGQAVFLNAGQVCFANEMQKHTLLPIKGIPITFQGLAKHNLANAMAAIAAAWALDVPKHAIIRALQNFKPSLDYNPGRQNIIELNSDVKVLVDYAHNVDGYDFIIKLARGITKGKVYGVICAPGDRSDTNIIDMGKLAASGFDGVFIKEDADLRGRKKGEVAQLLYEGACSAVPKLKPVRVLSTEVEAIKAALSMAQAGDVVVVVYDQLEGCLKSIKHSCTLLGQGPKTSHARVAST